MPIAPQTCPSCRGRGMVSRGRGRVIDTIRDQLIRLYGHKMSDAEIEEAMDHAKDNEVESEGEDGTHT